MEDSQIIDLFFKRDEKAITCIAEQYGHYCTSIAYNILRNREDCEECVSDTWLHAWNSIPPDCPLRLRAWLGQITRNLSFDLYRKNHRQKRGSGELPFILSELEGCLPAKSTIDSRLEEVEIARCVSNFLRSIGREARVIFVRRYFYNDSILQIAKRYKISQSKVKSALYRTRRQLRLYLEQEGICL